MDGQYVSHKEVPYGWVLWVKPAFRGLLRLLGANPGKHDPLTAALDPAIGLPGPAPRPPVPRYPRTPRWWGA